MLKPSGTNRTSLMSEAYVTYTFVDKFCDTNVAWVYLSKQSGMLACCDKITEKTNIKEEILIFPHISEVSFCGHLAPLFLGHSEICRIS
jgi:hypothetical protein